MAQDLSHELLKRCVAVIDWVLILGLGNESWQHLPAWHDDIITNKTLPSTYNQTSNEVTELWAIPAFNPGMLSDFVVLLADQSSSPVLLIIPKLARYRSSRPCRIGKYQHVLHVTGSVVIANRLTEK